MSYVTAQRTVIVAHGLNFWLAWMSDLPGTVYRGRSQCEAVGRLVMDQLHELPGWFEVRMDSGFTVFPNSDPLTEEERMKAMKAVEEYRAVPIPILKFGTSAK